MAQNAIAGAGDPGAIGAPRSSERSLLHRYLEAVGFVAFWMTTGFTVRAVAGNSADVQNAYILLGLPLMVVFQLLVRREPLHTFWVRNTANFSYRPGPLCLLVAAILLATPVYDFYKGVQSDDFSLMSALWLAADMLGAIAAGLTVQNANVAGLRRGLPAFLVATGIGLSILALAAMANGKPIFPATEAFVPFAHYFLLYLAIGFVIEEVVFRGMIDSHVQPLPAKGGAAWLSALCVSVMWGLWHLPIAESLAPEALPGTIATVAIVHTLTGIPLSFCWRSSGSLILPCLAHAIIDSYRNVAVLGS